MTRNKSIDGLKTIDAGTGGRGFSLGSAGTANAASIVMRKTHLNDYNQEVFLEEAVVTKPGYTYVMDFCVGYTGSHNYSANRARLYINGGMVIEAKDGIGDAYQCSQNVKWIVEGTGNSMTFGFRLNWDGGVAYKYLCAIVTEVPTAP